jgi:kynurenine formamidase
MKPIDLTHTFSIHIPGWVGYPSPKLSYFQRFATQGIVSQLLELPLHSGTHFDAEMHIISGGNDLASVPIDRLCREGVIVDISEEMHDWSVIKPHHVTDRIEVERGDILLYPLNTSIRTKWRPEIASQFEQASGVDPDGLFPVDDLFVMHKVPFGAGITHVENLGGDLAAMGTRRCLIGAFPIPIEGGEASPCRVVAFVDE